MNTPAPSEPMKTPNKESIVVSVIMATYNRHDLLPRAIDSILDQTLKNFEFIIIDDGSTDATAKLLQEYSTKDSRIKIITQENQGVAASRNNGAANAKGKYIALMDSDDVCAANRLELQLNFLENNPGIHATACETTDIDEFYPGFLGKDDINIWWNLESIYQAKGIKGLLGPSTTITKESFLATGGYRRQLTIIEDLDFTLRYSSNYKWGFMVGSSLYFYVHPLAQQSVGLSNADPLKSTQRHIASYLSAWCIHSGTDDPIVSGKDLTEIIGLTHSLPVKTKYLIFKSAGHLFDNIAANNNLTLNKSRAYVLDLLGSSFMLKHSILFWAATKDIIKDGIKYFRKYYL